MNSQSPDDRELKEISSQRMVSIEKFDQYSWPLGMTSDSSFVLHRVMDCGG